MLLRSFGRPHALAYVAAAVLLAGCSSGDPGAPSEDATPTARPTSTSETSSTPATTPEAGDDIDWSAPPDRVTFSGWQIDGFPVPRGSEPRVDGGRKGDFSVYLVFEGGDVEELSDFYVRVLRRDGYALDVDDYGTVRFAGDGVEGGVVSSRGDVTVLLNRAS